MRNFLLALAVMSAAIMTCLMVWMVVTAELTCK